MQSDYCTALPARSGFPDPQTDCIHFTQPYFNLSGKEQFRNKELNTVLAHSIYANLHDNLQYLQETQYNSRPSSKYEVKNKGSALERIISSNPLNLRQFQEVSKKESPSSESSESSEAHEHEQAIQTFVDQHRHLESHNIIRTGEGQIHIRQHIPGLTRAEKREIEEFQRQFDSDGHRTMHDAMSNEYPPMNGKFYNSRHRTMHDGMSNEYPPMNGLSYNNQFMNQGYNSQSNHRTNPEFALNQHNMYGGNDLLFPEGAQPYGFYNQHNYTGNNSLTYGAEYDQMMARVPQQGPPQYNKNMYKNDCPNYRNPYGARPMGRFDMQPMNFDDRGGRRMDLAYNHDVSYFPPMPVQRTKSLCNSVAPHKERREMSRKNQAKMKKGMLDINIETSSSNRQGISIDLNIGV